MKDFMDYLPSWMLVEESKQKHWIDIMNYVGLDYAIDHDLLLDDDDELTDINRKRRALRTHLPRLGGISRIQFASFENTHAAKGKFESANIGWYFIEQAEYANITVYNTLNRRLRRNPSGRCAWFVSNPNGRDWLWQMFSPESLHRRPDHSMHLLSSESADHLPQDFIDSIKSTMSEKDYGQWVQNRFDIATGAIYPEFHPDVHVFKHVEPPDKLPKAIGLDPGLNNPTAAIFAVKFPRNDVVYVYKEYYEADLIVPQHAANLKPHITEEHFLRMVDPTAWNRSQTDGISVLNLYHMHGLTFTPASKDVQAGINRIKEYLVKDPAIKNPLTGEMGCPRLIISDQCPVLIDQMMSYKKETLKTGIGESNEPEKPRKYNDHTVDALRFFFIPFTLPLSEASVDHTPHRHNFGMQIPETEYKVVDKDAAGNAVEFPQNVVLNLEKHVVASDTVIDGHQTHWWPV